MKTTSILYLLIFATSCSHEGATVPQQDASPLDDIEVSNVPSPPHRGPAPRYASDSDASLLTGPDAIVAPDTCPDLSPDQTPDLFVGSDTLPINLKPDLAPDLPPKQDNGIPCGGHDQCMSGFCTDGVCCRVAKCVDTCVPSYGGTCAPYNGFTCSPFGTCRGY